MHVHAALGSAADRQATHMQAFMLMLLGELRLLVTQDPPQLQLAITEVTLSSRSLRNIFQSLHACTAYMQGVSRRGVMQYEYK